MTYQPGDTANGYVLGEDNQWHPLPPEALAPPPPAQPTTALPQAYAAGPAAQPYQPYQPYQPAQPYEAAQPYQPVPPVQTQAYPPAQPQPYPPYQGSATPPGPRRSRPFYKAWWFWLIVVFVMIGLVVVLALSLLRSVGNSITAGIPSIPVSTPKTPVTPKAPAPAPTPGTQPSATPPSAGSTASGKTARDGDLQFTVNGVDCSKQTVGSAPLTKTAKGTFCLVSVTIVNSGSASADLNPFFQKAFDSSGKSYFPDIPAMIFMTETDSFADPIPAGASASGALPFDVPLGTTLTSVELHEEFGTAGAKIALP